MKTTVVLPDEVFRRAEAWKHYDALLRDERVFLALEPTGLESHWHRRTHAGEYSHRVWSGAYLVAFAEAGGFTNVSFDQGLSTLGTTKTLVLR